MASKVLSIEISNELIKLAEVSHQKNAVTVYKAATVATPEGSVEDGFLKNVDAIAESIKSTLKDNIMNPKDVVMTIQSSKIASKEAQLPVVKPNKIMELVKTNASDYFPVNNIDDYSLAYTVLETVTNGTEKNLRILAMAAPLNIVDTYYSLAKKLGLNVVAVDYIGNSTLQMLKLQIDETPSMVIQIGNDATIINVLKNKVLQFQRTVPYGRSAVTNAVMENKKLSYQVAVELLSKGSIIHERLDGEEVTESLRYLINSISRIVDYYVQRNQSSPIEKAYIIGEGANVGGIDRLFANELNINFNKITELKSVEPDKLFRISKTELITYLSTMGACINPVNFKQYQAVKVKQATSIDSSKAALAALAVAGLVTAVSFGIAGAKYFKLENRNKKLKSEIKKIESAEDTYNKWKGAKNTYTDIWSFYSERTSNPTDYLAEIFEALEDVLPADMLLTEMDIKDGKMTLSGYCRDKSTLAGALIELKKVKNPYDNEKVKGDEYLFDKVHSTGGEESISNDGIKTVEFKLSFEFRDPRDHDKEILKEAGLVKEDK